MTLYGRGLKGSLVIVFRYWIRTLSPMLTILLAVLFLKIKFLFQLVCIMLFSCILLGFIVVYRKILGGSLLFSLRCRASLQGRLQWLCVA